MAAAAVPGEAAGSEARGWPRLGFAALAALWLPLLWRWRLAWSVAPDQAYGWGVPAMALYLAWERGRSRPPARPPGPAGRAAAWCAVAAGLALFAAALPVLEANTLWPTAQWAGALAAALATLGGLTLAGGRGWAKHFAFPVGFIFTALTWPTPATVWVTTHLSGFNCRVAAEIVSAAGFPALVTGNVIEVGRGLVGVDEACSGLRSLQAVIMAACFFGELLRQSAPRRLRLVAAAVATALAANLVRTTFLTWQTAAHGPAAGERWHDPAGAFELALTLAVVGALAWRAGRRAAPETPSTGDCGVVARTSVRRWAGVVLAGALLAEAGTQAWYGWHEWRVPDAYGQWILRSPGPAWRPAPVPLRAQQVLQSSAASGLAWQDPATGIRTWTFVVTWRGDAARSENPEWHDPTICLPASGTKLAAELGVFALRIAGVRVAFTGYRFDSPDGPIEVFFCHWDAALAQARGNEYVPAPDLRVRRLQRVRDGRRRGDVAHLTFELETGNDAMAIAWLRQWAPRLLYLRR